MEKLSIVGSYEMEVQRLDNWLVEVIEARERVKDFVNHRTIARTDVHVFVCVVSLRCGNSVNDFVICVYNFLILLYDIFTGRGRTWCRRTIIS